MLGQNKKGKGQIKKSISKLIKIKKKLLLRFAISREQSGPKQRESH